MEISSPHHPEFKSKVVIQPCEVAPCPSSSPLIKSHLVSSLSKTHIGFASILYYILLLYCPSSPSNSTPANTDPSLCILCSCDHCCTISRVTRRQSSLTKSLPLIACFVQCTATLSIPSYSSFLTSLSDRHGNPSH